jgi:hypothetical protein
MRVAVKKKIQAPDPWLILLRGQSSVLLELMLIDKR